MAVTEERIYICQAQGQYLKPEELIFYKDGASYCLAAPYGHQPQGYGCGWFILRKEEPRCQYCDTTICQHTALGNPPRGTQ